MLATPHPPQAIPEWLAITLAALNGGILALVGKLLAVVFRVGKVIGGMEKQLNTMWDWYIVNTQRLKGP